MQPNEPDEAPGNEDLVTEQRFAELLRRFWQRSDEEQPNPGDL